MGVVAGGGSKDYRISAPLARWDWVPGRVRAICVRVQATVLLASRPDLRPP